MLVPTPDAYTITAFLGVCAYYAAAWALIVRAPKAGTIVTLYEPPEHLSAAAVRYAWKRTFDDRTFWAAVLSIVSKGLATLHSEHATAVLRLTPAANLKLVLPQEEKLLIDEMLSHRSRKGMKVSMLDGSMAVIASEMADLLRREALGVRFKDNRRLLIIGTTLSVIAILVATRPRWAGEWFALGLSFAFMVPSAYYLPFLLLRLRDLYRTAHDKLDRQVVSRGLLLIAWIVPCVAGITLGFVELGGTFGWPVLEATSVVTILDVSFLHFMRTPTEEGRKLLDKVEGFRLFLQEVDQHPMNQFTPPHEHSGIYEKFLPYAVALEVEQAWCNRFLALASTFHQPEPFPNTQSFYLGMWDGKPCRDRLSPSAKVIFMPQQCVDLLAPLQLPISFAL